MRDTQTYEALSYVAEAAKRSVGYEAEHFIIDCQFDGYPCYTESVPSKPRRILHYLLTFTVNNDSKAHFFG